MDKHTASTAIATIGIDLAKNVFQLHGAAAGQVAAGVDGCECDWGRVLAWEPPTRLLLQWRLDAEFAYDQKLHTEVEVRVIAEAPDRTRNSGDSHFFADSDLSPNLHPGMRKRRHLTRTIGVAADLLGLVPTRRSCGSQRRAGRCGTAAIRPAACGR